METINPNLNLLLNGQDIEEPQDYCDFSLEEQNEIAVSKGQAPSAPPDFIPKLKQSVCYVVMAVIFNEKNEILMIQEAKSTCAGQWYLPAGRVEPNENLTDAFKREVLEETGLLAEPSTLLMVESAAGSWYRFVLAGNVVGNTIIISFSKLFITTYSLRWIFENTSTSGFRISSSKVDFQAI